VACFRGVFSHWRKIRHRDQPDPHVVHLYFLPYHGFSYYYLHGPRLLDEYEKIHEGSETKSLVLFIALIALSLNTVASVRIRGLMLHWRLHAPAKCIYDRLL